MALYEQGVVVQYDGHGHLHQTVSTTVVPLPAPPNSVPWSRIRRVVVRNLGQPIDWTSDNTDPDGINSFKSLADEIVVLDTDFQHFRMVRSPSATADADVRIAYFGIQESLLQKDYIGVSDDVKISVGRGRSVDEFAPVRGHVRIELFGPDGELKDFREIDNLIVTVGKNLIADNLLATPTLGKPGWMELGTGTVAPAAGDTALGTVIASSRVALTSKTRSTNVVTMVGNWAAGTATNAAITEAGVFDAASAGNMSSRATFTAINKGAADTLQITWTYTVG